MNSGDYSKFTYGDSNGKGATENTTGGGTFNIGTNINYGNHDQFTYGDNNNRLSVQDVADDLSV